MARGVCAGEKAKREPAHNCDVVYLAGLKTNTEVVMNKKQIYGIWALCMILGGGLLVTGDVVLGCIVITGGALFAASAMLGLEYQAALKETFYALFDRAERWLEK